MESPLFSSHNHYLTKTNNEKKNEGNLPLYRLSWNLLARMTLTFQLVRFKSTSKTICPFISFIIYISNVCSLKKGIFVEKQHFVLYCQNIKRSIYPFVCFDLLFFRTLAVNSVSVFLTVSFWTYQTHMVTSRQKEKKKKEKQKKKDLRRKMTIKAWHK